MRVKSLKLECIYFLINYYLFNKNNKSKKENSYADRDALKEVNVA